MLRRTVAALSALPLVLAGGALNSASAAGTESSTTTPEYSDGIYVVQMLEPPAAGYTGGKAGLKATKPAPGRSLNPGLPRVRDYVGHLEDKQSAALKAVGNPRTLYTYQYAFSGLFVFNICWMRSCVLASPARLRKASLSMSSRYCSDTC